MITMIIISMMIIITMMIMVSMMIKEAIWMVVACNGSCWLLNLLRVSRAGGDEANDMNTMKTKIMF